MSMVVLPLQFVVDANGNVRVGSKMYVHDAGTTTPRTSYTTPPSSVPHPNPVVSMFPAIHVNPAGGNPHRPSAVTRVD